VRGDLTTSAILPVFGAPRKLPQRGNIRYLGMPDAQVSHLGLADRLPSTVPDAASAIHACQFVFQLVFQVHPRNLSEFRGHVVRREPSDRTAFTGLADAGRTADDPADIAW
jgi:hypothetical protein